MDGRTQKSALNRGGVQRQRDHAHEEEKQRHRIALESVGGRSGVSSLPLSIFQVDARVAKICLLKIVHAEPARAKWTLELSGHTHIVSSASMISSKGLFCEALRGVNGRRL